ncbi:cytochrome-c peroxidase [Flavobacterium sp. XGLA_31]|uniref:cytochrome-c peroxidase n=1 Tax=Flavobacterium sp. XGLA_31 TaxID=3447666 RepID=UPI003F32A71E
MKKQLFALSLLVIVSAFLNKDESEVYFYIPQNWPKPVYDVVKNPVTKDKVALGRALFYDPILSKNNTISCASCHSQYTAFAHIDHKLSHGIEDRIGTRNAPGLFNLAWNKTFMWDGSVHHLDAQAIAPLSNPLEMDEKLEHVVAKLQSSKRYTALFQNAYGDSLITGERTLKAISQFMLTLISANAKYDKVMRKEPGIAFIESENNGYALFKRNCANCHKEPLFTTGEYENNGLQPDSILRDSGRMKITHDRRDSLRFKVPSLRNVEVTSPYMHDGRYPNLQMVLFHYTQNVYHSQTLSKPLEKKIVLSEKEKGDIISFLKTLTDETFLRNPKYGYPKATFSTK